MTTPSIASLSKITIALGVSISTLLDENPEENQDIILVRRGQRKKIAGPGSDIGFAYESLAYKKKRKIMEPFIIKYPPGGHVQKLFEHEGEEMVFILKGKIKLIYGDKVFILRRAICSALSSSSLKPFSLEGDQDQSNLNPSMIYNIDQMESLKCYLTQSHSFPSPYSSYFNVSIKCKVTNFYQAIKPPSTHKTCPVI